MKTKGVLGLFLMAEKLMAVIYRANVLLQLRVVPVQDLHRVKPHGIPALTWGFHLLPRNYLQLILARKVKLSLRCWSVTVCIKHTLGQAPCSGVVSQPKPKRSSTYFCGLFCFCFGIFHLTGLCLFVLLCLFFVRENHKVGWVGR